MKENKLRWEDLGPAQAEKRVFGVQRRIHRAAIEGNRSRMHKLQRKLVRSLSARVYAVHLAAEKSGGSRTPGIDGRHSLTDPQKLELARRLRLSQCPSPVRRVDIPKPGKDETRPLGIPTIEDRALQHLINLALQPEWEARFTRGTFGFRKGRSCHDALVNIRMNIQRTPKWVLDADVEKFFDRLDHDAILRKLETFPAMERAVRRILKAGAIRGSVFEPSELGTPQGGPLSPLLANIALCGLENALLEEFPASRVIDGQKIRTQPRLIAYADDFIVLHPSRAVIETARTFVSNWLAPLGLSLSETKTRICHTADSTNGARGFTFLGCEIRQHRVGRHQVSSYFNGLRTHIGPSKEATKRIYAKAAEIIESTRPTRKRNGQRSHREAAGAPSPEEILIHRLKPLLRGWANYYRPHNSKRAFSRFDHLLFHKLHRWAKRTHPKLSQRKLVDTFFNGGDPWAFTALRNTGEKIHLPRMDSTPIERHYPVRSETSYYDGDWSYWARRLGHYPSLPPLIARRLKRQHGKCEACRGEITSSHRILLQKLPFGKEGALTWRLVHEDCVTRNQGDTLNLFRV
jgi:RNA-directed DNA polymerase